MPEVKNCKYRDINRCVELIAAVTLEDKNVIHEMMLKAYRRYEDANCSISDKTEYAAVDVLKWINRAYSHNDYKTIEQNNFTCVQE